MIQNGIFLFPLERSSSNLAEILKRGVAQDMLHFHPRGLTMYGRHPNVLQLGKESTSHGQATNHNDYEELISDL